MKSFHIGEPDKKALNQSLNWAVIGIMVLMQAVSIGM